MSNMTCPVCQAVMNEVIQDVETRDGMIRRTRTGKVVCPSCGHETVRKGGEKVEYLDPPERR